ncbi:MAG: hypothetical protein JSV56_11890 [Methanomassiliicoccales archaeon]|nr:MAG: hypothetical protein JSV56_11890 [Methanomassiliicoccales archaeon]
MSDTDNRVVLDYLVRHAEMPQCPRCGDNIAMRKWGFKDSPTSGRLQVYLCMPSNYEFMIYPKQPTRKDVDNCPKCKSKEFVRKEGMFKPKTGGTVQKYYCSRCRYWFQRSSRIKRNI